MELRALIAEALLTRGQGTEILRCLRHCLAVQAHHYSTHGLIAMLDIKVDLYASISNTQDGHDSSIMVPYG